LKEIYVSSVNFHLRIIVLGFVNKGNWGVGGENIEIIFIEGQPKPVLRRVGSMARDKEITPAVQYEILLHSFGDFL
jgi:hypothetical protein